MNVPLKLTGISLALSHHTDILTKRPKLAWLEIPSENYFIEGGIPFINLEQIRLDYPISAHGRGLSLGSMDELNWQHLKKLKTLISRLQPVLVSDQLGWCSLQGRYFHETLPLPYTEEALEHVIIRIKQIQDYLNRQIIIENIVNYIVFEESRMTEWEFIKEIALQANCGILLNIKNVCLSAQYQHFNPYDYLTQLPADLVQEIHLTNPAVDEWKIYQQAIQYLGVKPTIIESNPSLINFDLLCSFAHQAEHLMRKTYVARKLAN